MRINRLLLPCRSVFVIALLSCFVVSLSGLAPNLAPTFQAKAAEESEAEHAHASLLANCKGVISGQKFKLAVEMKMDPGWHTYYKESGDAGMPTKIIWQLPPGFKVSELSSKLGSQYWPGGLPPGFKALELSWEKPHKLVDAGIVTYGYNDHTVISADIEAPAGLKVGDKIPFKAKVKWLVCKDACIPGSGEVELTLPVVAAATPDNQDKFKNVNFNGSVKDIKGDTAAAEPGEKKKVEATEGQPDSLNYSGAAASSVAGEAPGSPAASTKSDAAEMGLWAVFGGAFIGGFLLNLMPCVLPVISIKVFSLIKQAGDDPKHVFKHGITFAAGIAVSFLSLAALVIAIQSAGQKIGWGFQFQYPVFVFAMASIVTLFALSMFGVFYFDLTAGQQKIDKLADKEGLTGTFFKGVLATILSTPCTAPFLGAVLGFAFVQPWWVVAGIFFVIALGMSSPYLVLAVRPQWMKFMPKPGDWMEKFKESMGFLLLATAVWLISILAKLVHADAVIAAIAFLFSLSLACWIQGAFTNLASSGKRILIVRAIALSVLAGSYWLFRHQFPELLGTKATIDEKISENEVGGIQWQDFTPADLDKELKANKTVFIDFTAQWCLICKANEATIINTAPVIAKFKALNVVPLKADWTAQNADITDLLRKFGRSGVPVYVIYPAGSPDKPVVLPEALTQQIVLDALDKAGTSK